MKKTRKRVQTTTIYVTGTFGFASVRVIQYVNGHIFQDIYLLTLEHGAAHID